MRKYVILIMTFAVTIAAPAAAATMCDTSYENCRRPLIRMIDRETEGIDVALWFIEDLTVSHALVRAHKRGVPIRVLMNLRPYHRTHRRPLEHMRGEGIPMRFKTHRLMFHPKAMIFAGQRTVFLGNANFTGWALKAYIPYVNYIDEVVGFFTEPAVVESAMREFDDRWMNLSEFSDYGTAPNRSLRRHYPRYTRDEVWVTQPEFVTRTVLAIRAETVAIDIAMYRATDWLIWNEIHDAMRRGVRVRMLSEPDSYFKWRTAGYHKPYNHVRGLQGILLLGGAVKHRIHQGLTHEKLVIFHGQQRVIFGSQNWTYTAHSQEWNLDLRDSEVYRWSQRHFNRKWNAPTEFKTFRLGDR